MTDIKKPEGFCTECGFVIESFGDLNGCPNCETKGIPCSYENQRNIDINWHELAVLATWAENWAHKTMDGAGVVYSIVDRIKAQYPDIKIPLTLAGEVSQLQEYFGADNIKTNIPGVEGSGSLNE